MNITDYYKVNTLVRADTTSTILNIKIGREILERRLGGIEVQPYPSLLKQLNNTSIYFHKDDVQHKCRYLLKYEKGILQMMITDFGNKCRFPLMWVLHLKNKPQWDIKLAKLKLKKLINIELKNI